MLPKYLGTGLYTEETYVLPSFGLTFEEDDLVVADSLIDRVQAVQVERQAPPETVDLSRLEGDQVLIASQSPEVLAWRDRLDITEPHCNPLSPAGMSAGHVAAAESKAREMGAMNWRHILLSSSSCSCFLFLAAIIRNPLWEIKITLWTLHWSGYPAAGGVKLCC